jgi:hypothetical protein
MHPLVLALGKPSRPVVVKTACSTRPGWIERKMLRFSQKSKATIVFFVKKMCLGLLLCFCVILPCHSFASPDGSEAIEAIRRLSEMYRGSSVEFDLVVGKRDVEIPFDLVRTTGFLSWDTTDQVLVEIDKETFEKSGELNSKSTVSAYFGKDFSISRSFFNDLSGGEDPFGFVQSNGLLSGKKWWSGLCDEVVSFNFEDDPGALLADVLAHCKFANKNSTSGQVEYLFTSPELGRYEVVLDSLARVSSIRITKTPENQWRGGTNISLPPYSAKILTRLFDEFQYDDSTNHCKYWKSTVTFQKHDGDRGSLETQFVARRLRSLDSLDPRHIKFRLLPLRDGSKFHAQDDEGIEYRWMDNQIVRVVDNGALETLNGSNFVPSSKWKQLWIVVGGTILVIALLCLAIRLRHFNQNG